MSSKARPVTSESFPTPRVGVRNLVVRGRTVCVPEVGYKTSIRTLYMRLGAGRTPWVRHETGLQTSNLRNDLGLHSMTKVHMLGRRAQASREKKLTQRPTIHLRPAYGWLGRGSGGDQ